MCANPSHHNANLLQISLVEMPSFSFNINVYGGDITFLPGVEKWINWFIETRVLRPYVLPERLTVPVKFLYDPTLEVTPLLLRHTACFASCAMHQLQDALWKVLLLLSLLFVHCYHHIVIVIIIVFEVMRIASRILISFMGNLDCCNIVVRAESTFDSVAKLDNAFSLGHVCHDA